MQLGVRKARAELFISMDEVRAYIDSTINHVWTARNIWPTDQVLLRLREQGKMPKSPSSVPES
jgi:hypothetical protein